MPIIYRLGLINKDHSVKPKMKHNDSNKFECIFSSVDIVPSPSIMLEGLKDLDLESGLLMEKVNLIYPIQKKYFNSS